MMCADRIQKILDLFCEEPRGRRTQPTRTAIGELESYYRELRGEQEEPEASA